MVKFCLIYTVPVSSIRSDFMVNIAVRMKLLLGKNVEFHVLYNGHLNEERLRNAGIHVEKICNYSHVEHNMGLRLMATAVKTYRYMKNKGIDVCCNANDHYFLFAPAIGARLAGKSILARITGILPEKKHISLPAKVKRLIKNAMEKTSLALADRIICLSDHLRQTLENKSANPEKMVTLSSGLDLERFQFQPLNEERDSFLFVGRIEKLKGIKSVLRFFEMYQKEIPHSKLSICGDGSMLKDLSQEYARIPGIHCHGHVTHNELPHFFSNASILILPSYSEGLPNVILEAMASGTAVIASNVGELPNLLGHGSRGMLVPPGDPDAIFKAALKFREDEVFFTTCIRNARDYVTEVHGFIRLRQNYLELLATVIH